MTFNLRCAVEVPHGASIVFLVTGLPQLFDFQFTAEEIGYMERKRDANPASDFFTFNKIDKFTSVIVVDSKGAPEAICEKLRRHGFTIQGNAREERYETIALMDLTGSGLYIHALAEGICLSCYTFDKYKTKQDTPHSLEILLVSPSLGGCGINRLQRMVEAVFLARDLVNEPVGFLTAVQFGEISIQQGQRVGLRVEVLGKDKIEGLKMGGLLGVNRGSVDPPTFTIIEWKPDDAKNERPYMIIGKGVMFDTGGVNLKTGPGNIDTMKCDMSGAASVLGVMVALAANNVPVHVIGLIPATDNRPGGNAIVPGDILTMHDGTTVEIINTDAEGRLILADAISFANSYDPLLIIDLATLTGSAAMAIGTHGMVGMGTADAATREKLTVAGEITNERIAWFPFWDDYDEALKSEVADIKNLGGKEAGAITAGKFLARFTSKPFIHLDIAGPAFLTTRSSYRGIGGTGIGVRLLYRFFESLVT